MSPRTSTQAVSPSSDCQALSVRAILGARLPTMTTTTAAVVFPHLGCLRVHNLSPRTFVFRRPGLLAYRQAFSHHPLLMPTAHLLAFVQSTPFCDSALMKPCHLAANDWRDAWRTHPSCSSGRRATLTSHLFDYSETAPEFLDQSRRRSPGPALHSDQRSRRKTDKLQILSWNPGPARGSDPSLLASYLNGP